MTSQAEKLTEAPQSAVVERQPAAPEQKEETLEIQLEKRAGELQQAWAESQATKNEFQKAKQDIEAAWQLEGETPENNVQLKAAVDKFKAAQDKMLAMDTKLQAAQSELAVLQQPSEAQTMAAEAPTEVPAEIIEPAPVSREIDMRKFPHAREVLAQEEELQELEKGWDEIAQTTEQPKAKKIETPTEQSTVEKPTENNLQPGAESAKQEMADAAMKTVAADIQKRSERNDLQRIRESFPSNPSMKDINQTLQFFQKQSNRPSLNNEEYRKSLRKILPDAAVESLSDYQLEELRIQNDNNLKEFLANLQAVSKEIIDEKQKSAIAKALKSFQKRSIKNTVPELIKQLGKESKDNINQRYGFLQKSIEKRSSQSDDEFRKSWHGLSEEELSSLSDEQVQELRREDLKNLQEEVSNYNTALAESLAKQAPKPKTSVEKPQKQTKASVEAAPVAAVEAPIKTPVEAPVAEAPITEAAPNAPGAVVVEKPTEAKDAPEVTAVEAPIEKPAEDTVKTEQKSKLDSLQKRFSKFNNESIEVNRSELNSQLEALHKNFNEENLEKLNGSLKSLEASRAELFSFADEAFEQIKSEEPYVQKNVKRAIESSERQLTQLIDGVREAARLTTINQRKFDFTPQAREKVQRIGERGLVGETELQGMLKLDNATSDGAVDALKKFLHRFETSFHGGQNLWNKINKFGLAFLESKQGLFKKNPAVAAEYNKLLKTIQSGKNHREEKMQSDRRGTWL